MIKLVIFDLDGVLTETSIYHFKAWRALAKKHGIDLPNSFEAKLKGVSRMASLEAILEYGNKQNAFSELEKQQMTDEKNTHYQSLAEDVSEKDLFTNAKFILNYLRTHNIKIALGSASKNGPKLIKALNIEHYFDYVTDPTELNSKPAPDIFLAPLKFFDLSPEEAVAFEDAPLGVEAIKRTGMKAVGIGNKEELKDADYYFKDLKSISIESLKTILKR